ncbi:SRPBCC domain-containing protein [Sphingomonas jatrophae]|uniref:Uncharacterized conserved protein YndB, AHSA1/START domain n=1 Tax=Sphingomonas jatrophae TaxID=1166337 RepID=A0A1I6LIG8_9SPHN|nr:SRPBCC domain-containing protein [Sphingomonas jatrophae]SFS03098.1 Uncharacterized conserved protein YndB, AHSA1/START domain [Sphingomonas jatrophae]
MTETADNSCAIRPAQAHELTVERRVAAPPATVRRMWEERIEEWFCPRPWRMVVDRLDLHPGGVSQMRMLGPDGEDMPNHGIVLEASEHRIVTTDAFQSDWQPAGPFMVGIWSFDDDGAGGTILRGTARHWTEEACAQHEAMGFAEGWGACLDQLKTLAEGGSID